MNYEITVFNINTMQPTTKFTKWFEFEVDAIEYCKLLNADYTSELVDFVYFITDREFV